MTLMKSMRPILHPKGQCWWCGLHPRDATGWGGFGVGFKGRDCRDPDWTGTSTEPTGTPGTGLFNVVFYFGSAFFGSKHVLEDLTETFDVWGRLSMYSFWFWDLIVLMIGYTFPCPIPFLPKLSHLEDLSFGWTGVVRKTSPQSHKATFPRLLSFFVSTW